MALKVITAEGKSVTVGTENTVTVQDLKERISHMTERGPNEKGLLSVSDQFLFFNGSALKKKQKTIL